MIQWATLDQEIQRVTLKRKLYMEMGIFHSATEMSAWSYGQHWWLCLEVILIGPTVKTNKWYVSTLPLYLYLSKMCIHLQLKEVWLWEGVKPRTKKLLSFSGISPKSIIYWRAPRYCIWQIWVVARFRCEPGPRAALGRRGADHVINWG